MSAPVIAAAARPGAANAGAATGAAAQKAAISKIKAARPTPSAPGATPQPAAAVRSTSNRRPPRLPSALTDQRGAPAAFRRFRDPVRAANAGGGFALGLMVYVVALNYLEGGKPQVNAWLRAKFLNQVNR